MYLDYWVMKQIKLKQKKRPLSSMTPTIVLKNDKPFLVLGTPGGSTIITTVLQNIFKMLPFTKWT